VKTIIHVNQHNIRYNIKNTDDRKKVLAVKNYKSNIYTDKVSILDKDGQVVAVVRYSPDKPLSCGARVWIETTNEVLIEGEG
tara:strand:+ start:2876 stop:3121 length:246 start_codon:yes stop_codon:yes gene_type:complete